jgi:hypothetical protein
VTFDIVGLCRREPDPSAVFAAMLAAGPDLGVDSVGEQHLMRLHDPGGRVLLTTEGARLVRIPGEARRVLGLGPEVDVPHPVWWVESRAPDGDPEAEAVARAFTGALVAWTGGVSWSNR